MAPYLWHQKQKALALGQIKPEARSLAHEPLLTPTFAKLWLLNLMLCGWSFMINATFPLYIKQLGGTELLVGVTTAGFALTSLLMRPAAGWMLDNLSRGGLLRGGVLGLAFISVLYLLAPVLALVVGLRWISGFVLSGVTTASNTNSCDTIPQSRFGEGMGLLGLGNTLATALGPALGLAIIIRWNFKALFAVSILIALLSVLIVRGLTYKQVVRRAYLPGRYRLRLRDLFNADALPASVVTLFAAAPYGGVSAFIALYGNYSGLGVASLFFVLVAVGTGSTRLFAGRLADKKGERPMLIVGNSCFLLALLLLLCGGSSAYYLSGLFFGWGFGFSTPAMQTMAVRIVPLPKRGSASSTFLCSYDIGSVLGALSAGWLVTVFGYRPMFGIMIIFIIASWLAYGLWAAKSPSAFKNFQLTHNSELAA